MAEELRTERINIRIKPSIKLKAEILADEDGRTLSNWIEMLMGMQESIATLTQTNTTFV